MPESALITAMISAMQAFIHEVSGAYAKKLSTGGFVFHIDRVGKLIFVLATSDEERPNLELTNLRTRFLHKFGAQITSFRGATDEFRVFEKDVREIFDINSQIHRIEPEKPLTSFALIQIPQELQEAARLFVMKKELSVADIKEETGKTTFEITLTLEKLFELGYIGRYHNGKMFIYFI